VCDHGHVVLSEFSVCGFHVLSVEECFGVTLFVWNALRARCAVMCLDSSAAYQLLFLFFLGENPAYALCVPCVIRLRFGG